MEQTTAVATAAIVAAAAVTIEQAATAAAAAAATVAAKQAGLGRALLTAHQGDANHREEHRDAEHECTIHPKILQQ
jgi:hypothetical protein